MMGITRKDALIKMMIKIITVDLVAQSPVFSALVGLTCCFWGALYAVTLDEQFLVVQLTCGSSVYHGFLCVCC